MEYTHDKKVHAHPLGTGFAQKDIKAQDEFEAEYFESNCCSAAPLGEMHESFHLNEYWGLCGQCKEHAEFIGIDIYGNDKDQWEEKQQTNEEV